MAAELLGAKLLAPFFGSSLYVWSSVMAVTLLGLASGYFVGGVVSTKANLERRLYLILVIGAIVIAVMPFSVQFCFALFSQMKLLPSVILSSIFLLVPPVFFMGMVSPLIIKLIDGFIVNPGKSSGTVYAISTVGGILATFSFGFIIIPKFGLVMPCVATAFVLGIIPSVMLIRGKSIMPLTLLFALWFSIKSSEIQGNSTSRIKVLEISEGILGQLLVVDLPNDYYFNDSTKKNQYSRWLFVNRTSQTYDDKYADPKKGEERYFTYVYKIEKALDTLAKGKKILLLGLGGGAVVNHLSQCGYSFDVCELDDRIYHVAQKYFGLNKSAKVEIDDARHYINTCNKKYDVIIFDTFKGEETPNHVFTKQSLTKVKSMLNEGGLVFVNSFGYWKNKRGLGIRSIYKTFTHEKFNTIVVPTDRDENQRNLVFVASFDQHLVPNESCIETKLSGDEVVLDDEYPVFEKLNSLAALSWRKSAIQTFMYDSLQKKIPYFK